MLLGLIGANIGGSLSPALFAACFEAAGIDGYYHLLDVDRLAEQRLPQLLAAIRTAGFAGANITYPFKQKILPLLDAVDAEALQLGAVNTVTISQDGTMTGHNFDRPGWRRGFEEELGRKSAVGATVVLIGAGGAGHAVAFGLMDLGVAHLTVHDQDTARAEALCETLAACPAAPSCRVSTSVEEDLREADGVVNATQTGMRGFPGNPVPTGALRKEQWCADVVYTPIETEFLKAARVRGARVLNGSGMCIHAARGAFELFTGIAPDVRHLSKRFAQALLEREDKEPAWSDSPRATLG